jgi:vacuolar-type H+-ATPase subunit E/Vma4
LTHFFSLNMITTKMLDGSQNQMDLKSLEANQRVLEPFFKSVSENYDKIQENTQRLRVTDKEVDRYANAVESGLEVVGDIFKDKSQDVNYLTQRRKSAQSSYLVGSNQMNNIKTRNSIDVRVNRNRLQTIQSDMN